MYKFLKKENTLIILIVFISIFFSISYSYEQDAVDGGFAYSGLVKYPESFSVMKAYYFNSWTLLHQIPAFFLKLNLSIINTSRLILFLSTLFFLMGIYLTVKSISLSSILAFFVAFTVLMFRKNFGDIGYPTLIFSAHTYGMMSLAVVTFIFGLISNGNLFIAGFFSVLLISMHPVIGIWITSVILFSTILIKLFLKDLIIDKRVFYGMLLALIPVLISLFFYYLFSIEKNITSYDDDAVATWVQLWDSHRTNWGQISHLNYEYLIKSFFLIISCFFYLIYFNQNKNDQNRLMMIIVLTSSITSILIYIVYKLHPSLFPGLIKNVIPSRFVLMHSVIGWPILISLFYLLSKTLLVKNKFNPIYASILIYCILFTYNISHYKNIVIRADQFILNLNDESKKYEDNAFWNNVKKIEMKGLVLTSVSSRAYYISRHSLKPILLNLEIINTIPYLPILAGETKRIIEDVYGFSFDQPPIKYVPCIPEYLIKENFEKRTANQWKILSNKFNFNWVIVPTSWNIDLNVKLKNKNYSFYDINDRYKITVTADWFIDQKKYKKIDHLINNCYPHQ